LLVSLGKRSSIARYLYGILTKPYRGASKKAFRPVAASQWGSLQPFMKNYSLTYAGIIAAAVGYVFQSFSVPLPFTNEEIEKAITTIVTLLGLIIALVGRYRRGDITWTGFKINLPVFGGRKVINEGERVQL
jgi:hypothetical protein